MKMLESVAVPVAHAILQTEPFREGLLRMVTDMVRTQLAKEREDERDSYLCEPNTRYELADGLIVYEADGGYVGSGEFASVVLGLPHVTQGYIGTLPQVLGVNVEATFQPTAVRLPPGFALYQMFLGAENTFPVPIDPTDRSLISWEVLAQGYPQPQLSGSTSSRARPLTVRVKNVTGLHRTLRVRVEGRIKPCSHTPTDEPNVE